MINEELLKIILADKEVNKVELVGNNLWFKKTEPAMSYKWSDYCINIYELAHKCKEWAINKGFILDTSYNEKGMAYCDVYSNYALISRFSNDTEPKVIFEACEFIRKVLQKNDTSTTNL